MAKKPETYDKVAATFKKKADRAWAKAKNGEGDHNYAYARANYATAEKAKRAAELARKKSK